MHTIDSYINNLSYLLCNIPVIIKTIYAGRNFTMVKLGKNICMRIESICTNGVNIDLLPILHYIYLINYTTCHFNYHVSAFISDQCPVKKGYNIHYLTAYTSMNTKTTMARTSEYIILYYLTSLYIQSILMCE